MLDAGLGRPYIPLMSDVAVQHKSHETAKFWRILEDDAANTIDENDPTQ
ncbi:MAG: hypothetical protein ORN98_01945 [Alphaproteobacteria bacterium]|nr:hypothetical protein [Alphaproteobacteria bacterium]